LKTYVSQNLLAPNLSMIAKEFGFNNEERDQKLGGDIAFGFFVVGGPVALLVGYFADTVNRCILFGVVILLGETACFATYWVKTYNQLYICRILTGISVGGATPVIYSLLADYYPTAGGSRIFVSTLIGIGMNIGISFGQFIAGFVGPKYGWKLPFLIVSIPSIICATLVILTAKEPRRGGQEEELQLIAANIQSSSSSSSSSSPPSSSSHFAASPLPTSTISTPLSGNYSYDSTASTSPPHPQTTHNLQIRMETSQPQPPNIEYSEKINCSKICVLFQTPSVVLTFLQGLPGCLPWGMIYVFLNDYFSSNIGMSVEQSTGALFLFGIGGLFGQLLGGWLGRTLYLIDKRYQVAMIATSTALSTIPLIYLLNEKSTATPSFYSLCAFAGLLACITGPNIRSILQV
jgi:MFS family permease